VGSDATALTTYQLVKSPDAIISTLARRMVLKRSEHQSMSALGLISSHIQITEGLGWAQCGRKRELACVAAVSPSWSFVRPRRMAVV